MNGRRPMPSRRVRQQGIALLGAVLLLERRKLRVARNGGGAAPEPD